MPLTGEAKRVYNQRYYQRRKLARQTGILPETDIHTHIKPSTVRSRQQVKTATPEAFKYPVRPAVNARPSPAVPPDRVAVRLEPRNAPQTGLSYLELVSQLVAGKVPSNNMRPKPAPSHAVQVPSSAALAAGSPKPERPAVPPTKRFRLPDSLQSPRKSPAVASLIRKMFG